MPRRHLLQLVCLAILAAALPHAPGHAQPSSRTARLSGADEGAALAWLKKSGHPLSSESPAASELKPLLVRLEGARVIGLGEATHGTHEDLAFKSALIKALAGAGRINAVAFITSYQSGKRLDAYVAGGPGTAAEALRASGLSPAWISEEVADLLDWLRRWNAAGEHRVRVVGVDVQDALRDTQAALELLSAIEPDAAGPLQERWKDQLTPEQLRRPFAQVARGWTRTQWEEFFVAAQVLEDVLARPTMRLRQAPGYADARHSARAARLGLLTFEVGAAGTSSPEPSAEAELARDLSIGEQLLAIVGPPARAVLWAHDAQIARGAAGRTAAYSTGDLLLDRLGAGYRTVGFAWRRGAFHAQSRDAAGNIDGAAGFKVWNVTLPADSLGAMLARSGQRRAWFDLSALPGAPWSQRWLAHPYERGWVGLATGGAKAPPAALGHGFDVIVFFDTITPSRLLRLTQ